MNSIRKIRYIDPIFERDKTRKYTEDALLLQDLLRYSLVINTPPLEKSNAFKLRELQNWIVRNNKQMLDYWNKTIRRRNTPYSNRVHAMEGKINNKFEILLELNLVRKNGSDASEKIKGLQIPLYKYRKSGVLLALIIKSMNLRDVIAITKKEDSIAKYKKELDKIHGDIYEVFHFVYKIKKDSPAADIFYSIFIQKCKEKGIFEPLVNRIHFVLSIPDWHYNIISISHLLVCAIYDPFLNKKSQTDFTDVLQEVIRELDQESRELILYEIKDFAENKFASKLEHSTHFTRQYELFRRDLRGDYERIALQGYCERCKSNQNVPLHYLDLRISLVERRIFDCPRCNTKGSLLIHNF